MIENSIRKHKIKMKPILFCIIISALTTVNILCQEIPREERDFSKDSAQSRGFPENLTPEQISQLEAIGYLSGYVAPPEKLNVTVYDKERAYNGLNFFSSPHKASAYLVDMQGNTLHEWSCKIGDVWPGKNFDGIKHTEFWRRVYLYPNGDVLGIFENIGIVKLDRNSNVIWKNDNRAHHDLEILENGDIWVLTNKLNPIPKITTDVPVQEDYLTLMDKYGNIKREFSLLSSIVNSEFRDLVEDRLKYGGNRNNPVYDIFHTNTLEVLDGRVEHIVPVFKKGNILTSFRNLNLIAVIDQETGLAVWAYQGKFRAQHDPKILENGNLLLFDNLGSGEASTVLEYDLETMEIVWFYSGTEESPFFTEGSGTSERLPNGNTLITETRQGRVFEVTPNKEIVWEFFNPNLVGENKEIIAAIWEMIRIPKSESFDWIPGISSRP